LAQVSTASSKASLLLPFLFSFLGVMGCTSSTNKKADAKARQLTGAADVASKTEASQAEGAPKVEAAAAAVSPTTAELKEVPAATPEKEVSVSLPAKELPDASPSSKVEASKQETAKDEEPKQEAKVVEIVANLEDVKVADTRSTEEKLESAEHVDFKTEDVQESKDASPSTKAAGTEVLPVVVIEDIKTTLCCSF
jgi:hypothetical protein